MEFIDFWKIFKTTPLNRDFLTENTQWSSDATRQNRPIG